MTAPTLKSIARATGFSITTVSRALGGYDDVSEETRRLILEEAQRQGYAPNLNARLLQGQRTQTIGLIIPASGPRVPDQFFSEFVAGVSHQAAAAGYDLLLSTSAQPSADTGPYRRLVSRGRVDGLVLARTSRDDARIAYLLETTTPFVVFGRTAFDGFPYIDVDGVAGQCALTEHFIALGHRRIAYICPPAHLMFAEYRLEGFRAAMQRHNIPLDPSLIVHGDLTEKSGRELAHHLLSLPHPPTAIMAGNDLMAFGVMSAVQAHGLRVGDDVAVGGFDDVPLAEYIHPGLTTIRQPIYEIGERLTEMLLRMLAGDTLTERAVLLKPELIVRASSGPPRVSQETREKGA